MITLTKYGEKYNSPILRIELLSSETKPIVTYIEYDDNGIPVAQWKIPNGSELNEVDTGKTYKYDAEGHQWYEVNVGGGGGTSDGIHGKSSGTTENNIVTWGADGYNVKDSGTSIASNYIEFANGQRVYFSSTVPTGTIPDGSIGIGF